MTYAEEVDGVSTLKEEHKGIAVQLELMRSSIFGLPPATSEELLKSIDRLRSLIGRHFEKEERGLYKSLRLKLRRDNPVDIMAQEHRLILKTIEGLRSASARYEADSGHIATVRSCFNSLQTEVGEHTRREESVLFWLADLKL